MRELRFRGKDIETGEWVVGMNVFFTCDRERKQYRALMTPSGSRVTHALVKTQDGNKWQHSYDSVEVDVETVGQYTGQNDRNGKMIFEGDILSLPEEEYANIKLLVEFRDCGWKLRWHGDKNFNHELAAWDGKRLNFKVVGNIHDNPELLKKEE